MIFLTSKPVRLTAGFDAHVKPFLCLLSFIYESLQITIFENNVGRIFMAYVLSVKGFSKTDGKELFYIEPFWWKRNEFTEDPE